MMAEAPPLDLDPSYLEGCASLLDQIDKKVLVVLRDNRNVIGILRSCDQFNNLVLDETVERIHLNQEYSEIPLGIFIVRGDNVLVVGEMDEALNTKVKSQLKQIPSHLMLVKKRGRDEQDKAKEAMLKKASKDRGLSVHDPASDD